MKGTCASLSLACAQNVHSHDLSCTMSVGEKRKRNEYGESGNTRGDELAQPKTVVYVGLKFNDFEKVREEVNFTVGQTWALYDTADGMPRVYAQIRKVSAPGFGVRITYLEPDPDDEKELQWFEEELPVAVGKFRLGKNQNTEDRSKFSHLMHCNEGSNTGHFTVSPRKGETWAMFKNWDINWSSEPDSHRKYEYEFVEVLSDYADGVGVSVAFLHRANGFASVFFRMGTADADISQILPDSLYRFSHRILSFKMTGIEGKDVPKDAYELDQAALPEIVEEITVPSYLVSEAMVTKRNTEVLCFPREGKVFQTGQIWSYIGDYDTLPRYYGRIQEITLTETLGQATDFALHVNLLRRNGFRWEVIPWNDEKMPNGCGAFSAMKRSQIFDPVHCIQQMMPQSSKAEQGYYIILPRTGQVWAIYRFWSPDITWDILQEFLEYDIVEVLDDASDFKVLQLEPALLNEDDTKKKKFKAAETRTSYHDAKDGSDVIFTIPKSKMLRFSHQVSASRVTKEVDGEMKELFEINPETLPHH